jgi:hypothetical protein
MLCANVGDVLFARKYIVLNDFLPVLREPILPLSMPFCFGLPPAITGVQGQMRPMPNDMLSTFGDNLTIASAAYSSYFGLRP